MKKIRISAALILCLIVGAGLAVTGCSSKSDSPSSSSSSTTYAQTDLTGTWNFSIFFASSTHPSWARGTASVDSSGGVSFVEYEDSTGGSGPASGDIIFTIDSSGTITQSGNGVFEESHCAMSKDKNTVLCSVTKSSNVYATMIMFKTTGFTFSNADVTGPLSFNTHMLCSGYYPVWGIGSGTIDASRLMAFNGGVMNTPIGAIPSGSATLSVGADGIVSINSTRTGMISSDKKMIVFTVTMSTSPQVVAMFVSTVADETFTGTSNLAGTWQSAHLWGGWVGYIGPPDPDWGWAWITGTINSSGVASMTEKIDSKGSTVLGSDVNMSMTTGGIITSTDNPTFHGVLSHDRIVSVLTIGDNVDYELDIAFKK